ncbi:MAG: DUF4097 family beta strand repeat-containing protein [Eubacteriaceae bacterium]|nr:DUF4097 family beta strand repeat-containing protein [Eubacteriaceae bacterium]
MTARQDYGDLDISGAEMTDAVIKAEDGNVIGKGITTGGDVKITSDSGDIKISGSMRAEKADPKSNINGSSDSGDVRLIFK